MTRRAQVTLGAAALAVAGTAAVLPAVTGNGQPEAKGLISQAVTVSAPTPKCLETPGKAWGGRIHYSLAILRPTVIERACVSYPLRRTLVKVTYRPVTP